MDDKLVHAIDETTRTLWVLTGLCLLSAVTSRGAGREARHGAAHTAQLEAAALTCAACQPTSGGAA
jgi:hypothetical protein